jgi:hypothetical protein
VSQRDSNSLTLRWSEFKDRSQLQTYSAKVSYGDSVTKSWQEIGNKNYLKISHLNMVNGGSPKNACPVSSTAFIQRTVPYTRLP